MAKLLKDILNQPRFKRPTITMSKEMLSTYYNMPICKSTVVSLETRDLRSYTEIMGIRLIKNRKEVIKLGHKSRKAFQKLLDEMVEHNYQTILKDLLKP